MQMQSGRTALAALVCLGLSAPPVFAGIAPSADVQAHGAASTPFILGGNLSDVPWTVRIGAQGGGGGTTCSAVAISPNWLITAAHCPSVVTAYFPGRSIHADRAIDSPTGDIKLLHLSEPYRLAAYPRVDLAYAPRAGDRGTIHGLGRPHYELREATVNVPGESQDYHRGPGILLEGVSGSVQSGDSGGPLLIDGKVVGIASTGSHVEAINGKGVYGNLGASAAFVASAMIGAPTLKQGNLNVAIDGEFFKSSPRLMFWINGQYSGEVFDGRAYYLHADATGNDVTVSTSAQAGDHVQVGIVQGVPGDGVPPPASATLLSSTILDAVRNVKLHVDRVQATLGPWLVNSNERVVFWINGQYAGETHGGSFHQLYSIVTPGAVTVSTDVPAKSGDKVVIGIVPGTPGDASAHPSSAKVLADVVL